MRRICSLRCRFWDGDEMDVEESRKREGEEEVFRKLRRLVKL